MKRAGTRNMFFFFTWPYPVQYCLESVEEYSECTIHKGEPEPRKGNVNTVYFINHSRANTRISRTEFIYDESMRLQMV